MAVIHREITSIELARFRPHPKWIRGKLDPQKVEEMRASRRVHGQLVPFIAIPGFIIDGNTRAEAMRLDGITHADAILLEHEPTELEVLEIQMAIDVHRSGVPTTVRARILAAIQEAGGYTVSALAARTGMTQPWCSQLLAVNKASDEVKAMLNAERIDVEKAAILGANPDPVLVEQAPALSRDQLRQKIRGAGKPVVKTMSLCLPLPGNYMFTLKGPEFDLPTLLEVLQEAIKQCKKAMTNGHDIASISRYLRNTMKAKSAS